MSRIGLLLLALAGAAQDDAAWPPPPPAEAKGRPPGLLGPVGPRGEPKTARELAIREKGVFEDILVDAEFGDRDAVKIKADGTVLRHCEIRNAKNDGVEVYAKDVLIESCRIHHLLRGSFARQDDAHGITGCPTRLTIRNCEIFFVSGDSVQFDPGREPWTDVVIENCEFWTGPLPGDAAEFRKGEQPGENALDTKQRAKNPRSRILVRNSVFHGWRKGGQVSNAAALNLKNHVEVRVENCVFYDNEIALRLRGGAGEFGGARVVAQDCAFYRSDYAVRLEDRIEDVKILNPLFGAGVKFQVVGQAGAGLSIGGEREAPPLEELLKRK